MFIKKIHDGNVARGKIIISYDGFITYFDVINRFYVLYVASAKHVNAYYNLKH